MVPYAVFTYWMGDRVLYISPYNGHVETHVVTYANHEEASQDFEENLRGLGFETCQLSPKEFQERARAISDQDEARVATALLEQKECRLCGHVMHQTCQKCGKPACYNCGRLSGSVYCEGCKSYEQQWAVSRRGHHLKKVLAKVLHTLA